MLLKYWPEQTKFSFMALHWPAYALSALMLIASVFFISTRGLNLGIDFAGGSVIEMTEPKSIKVEDVRSLLGGLELGNFEVTEARGTGLDASNIVVIKVETPSGEGLTDKELEAAQQAVNGRIIGAMVERFPELGQLENNGVLSSASVGPKVSGELFRDGIFALGGALVLMLIYIWFRFEWQFSLGAVAALLHDVVITVGLFSLLQMEFNLTTIAALLTIIGYSMNDTVVVYDRIREEMRKYKKMPVSQVIDLALNNTLSRTLLTSGTTLIALLAIFFLGGPVLRGMSFALIWGIVIGTYSSIFVASALVNTIGVDLNKERKQVAGFAGAPE